MVRAYVYTAIVVGVLLLSGGHAAAVGGGPFYDHTGYSDDSVDTEQLAEEAINPSLRPIDWQEGAGQFPTFEEGETNGYSGYLQRQSDDRRVGMRYSFDESAFDHEVDQYLVVARVAWHANGAGDQKGISTNAASQDIPGDSATEEWDTVRLPIDYEDDPHVQLQAIYGSGYLASGTSVVRVQDLTVVPAESVGTLSNEEILEITSGSDAADSSADDEPVSVEGAINPSLRPVDWQEGAGQFPTFEEGETNGYSGYLERQSDDRRARMRYSFDESAFAHSVDDYLVVARVAWHANGAGDQKGISTNAATQDLPGDSATAEWGTVRLPIDHTDDPYVELAAIYGSGSLASGTSVVRLQDITIVPADSVGTLSNEEILEATGDDPEGGTSGGTDEPASESDETGESASESDSETTAGQSQSDVCQPNPDDPQLQAVQLHSSDTEIGPDDPGQITGGIATDIANNCPIRVQITLQVPSGMRINAGQNIESGSGGLVTSTFVVEPGEVKSISAEVTGSELSAGTKEVQSSISYYPVGNPERAEAADTRTLEFSVSESAAATTKDDSDETTKDNNDETTEGDSDETTEGDSGDISVEVPGFTPVTALIAAVSLLTVLRRRQ